MGSEMCIRDSTPIHVVQPGMPIVKIEDEAFGEHKAPLLISYHLKQFGLGEVGCARIADPALQFAAPRTGRLSTARL